MTGACARRSAILHRLWFDHARYAWDDRAVGIVSRAALSCVPVAAMGNVTGGLCFPGDVPFDADKPPVTADCFGVAMPMMHAFDPADFPDFAPVAGHAWLWRNRHGALMPAFNLWGFVEHFLGFAMHRQTDLRDRHGRIPWAESPLHRHGLSGLPIFNIYLFGLLGAASMQEHGGEHAAPADHVRPPIVVLSHDGDQLRGNDLFTQIARLARFLAPLRRLRMPAFENLKFMAINLLWPRRYYFDDALAMAAAEARYGFRSTFYFLNGKRGRFGARGGIGMIADLSARLPADCDQAIHYNYRNSSDLPRLERQLGELERVTGRRIVSGRAHYLAFAPEEDFAVLAAAGIANDESVGFGGAIGSPVGFAGAFRVFHDDAANQVGLVEIPLQFMDTNIAGHSAGSEVSAHFQLVEKVGGIVTMLFHPGSYDNPEHPRLQGLYDIYLEYFSKGRYRNLTAAELGDLIRAPVKLESAGFKS